MDPREMIATATRNVERGPVLAIEKGRDNADLIDACFELGYISDADNVLDCTYGLGRFWTRRRPTNLVASDLNPAKSPVGESIDFRHIPFDDETFDVVVFDPPYKLNGASRGVGPASCDADYGVAGEAVRWQDRHALIRDGIAECVRVLKYGGRLLVKCQAQVCSGAVRWQDREFADHAERRGARLVDRFDLLGHRKQPAGRRQVHARRNHSTLLVFERGNTVPILDRLIAFAAAELGVALDRDCAADVLRHLIEGNR
jgi:SAM-dependent methyltransferase